MLDLLSTNGFENFIMDSTRDSSVSYKGVRLGNHYRVSASLIAFIWLKMLLALNFLSQTISSSTCLVSILVNSEKNQNSIFSEFGSKIAEKGALRVIS